MMIAKKQLIIDKALELFAEKGFEATSVQEITEKCGISKGAFYLSFKSKDELIISIIDSLMLTLSNSVDQIVASSIPANEKLFQFYCTMFDSLIKNHDCTKLFMKEQVHNINKDILSKVRFYDIQVTRSILHILCELYGSSIENTKYDIMLCIKGFITSYSENIVVHQMPIDIHHLSRSLVEKTDVLAKHCQLSFVSKSMIEYLQFTEPASLSIEQIVTIINEIKQDISTPIEQESLQIMLQQLQSESPNITIILGMLHNIDHIPQCQWAAHLIRQYIDQFLNI